MKDVEGGIVSELRKDDLGWIVERSENPEPGFEGEGHAVPLTPDEFDRIARAWLRERPIQTIVEVLKLVLVDSAQGWSHFIDGSPARIALWVENDLLGEEE